jgi:hypothetical protein
MICKYNLDGHLKIGLHKTIFCKVKFEIETIDLNDDWAELDPNINLNDYIDGVRAKGEFHFETSPINDCRDHPVAKNTLAELLLYDEEESTKLNIFIVENISSVDVVPKKIKRYLWSFLPVGKPFFDKLNIFPKNYQGVKSKKKSMNQIYSCTKFRAEWPVEVASIIIAQSKAEAKVLLNQKLREFGIISELDDYELTEIDIDQKGAIILNSGENR